MTEPPALEAAVEVRYAEPGDWALVREIRLRSLRDSPAAFGATVDAEEAFSADDWVDRCRRPAVLALAAGRPVAVGSGFEDRPGWCRVVAMWTDPGWRGRGLAGRVLDLVVAWARDRGLRVHLDVAQANPVARRVYERYGFRATGETHAIREGSVDRVERMVYASAPR